MSDQVGFSAVVERGERLMSAPVDDEIVFLDMKSNNYLALDPVGARVWALLERPRVVADLVLDLEAEFHASADVISVDVMAFLAELSELGMVRVVDAPLP